MFVKLQSRDWLVIVHGITALFSCIIIGTIVVEFQLNQLTYWLDSVQVFNLSKLSTGSYLATILGTNYEFQAAWQIGTISRGAHVLSLSFGGWDFAVPLSAQFELTALISYGQRFYDSACGTVAVGITWLRQLVAGF